MQRLRIAEVVSEKLPVPPTRGGAIQTLVYNFAKLLKDRFDFTIFCRPTKEQQGDILKYDPIPETHVDAIMERLKSSRLSEHSSIIRLFAKGIIVYRYANMCGKKIDSLYDIIHIHNNPGFIPVIIRHVKKSGIILHMNNPHFSSKRYGKKLKYVYKLAIKHSDAIVCASQYILNDLLHEYGEAENKSVVIYNGIEVEKYFRKSDMENIETLRRFSFPTKPVKILFVGRIVPIKGLHVLIKALHTIKEKNFHLIVVGSSGFKNSTFLTEYVRYVLNLAESLKDKVSFLGYIDPEQVPYIYSVSDIFVLPSLPNQEACPLVMLEAMAAGCCIVASKTGPMVEMIKQGYNGQLFQAGNHIELAYILRDLLENTHLIEEFGKRARKTLLENDFSIVKMAERLEELFMRVYEARHCKLP